MSQENDVLTGFVDASPVRQEAGFASLARDILAGMPEGSVEFVTLSAGIQPTPQGGFSISEQEFIPATAMTYPEFPFVLTDGLFSCIAIGIDDLQTKKKGMAHVYRSLPMETRMRFFQSQLGIPNFHHSVISILPGYTQEADNYNGITRLITVCRDFQPARMVIDISPPLPLVRGALFDLRDGRMNEILGFIEGSPRYRAEGINIEYAMNFPKGGFV